MIKHRKNCKCCPGHSSVSVSQKCLKSVSKISQKPLKSVSKVSQKCLKSVSKVSQKCLKSVSKISQRSLKSVSKVSQKCLKRRWNQKCELMSEWQGHLLSCPGQLKMRWSTDNGHGRLSFEKKPSSCLCTAATTVHNGYKKTLVYYFITCLLLRILS